MTAIPPSRPPGTAVQVEEHFTFTLVELSRACRVDSLTIQALVQEGVLSPVQPDAEPWRFAGASLQRARRALRLTQGLDLSPHGVALVLELLDRIDALDARLARLNAVNP